MIYNNQNQIVGDVFIIPNCPVRESDWDGSFGLIAKEQWTRFKNRIHRVINEKEDEAYVQVWCCTPGEDDSNWSCHREMPDNENFATYLPASLFKNKKEGESVVVNTKWGEVVLTLAQLKYRYRRFGAFEETMKSLLS
jgi:hypothetical protein